MKDIKVTLDWEAVDCVTTCALASLLENLEDDFLKRKKGQGMAVFEKDKKKDLAIIKKHIDAFKLILNYYGKGNE